MAKKIREIRKPVKNLKMEVRARPNYLALTVFEEDVMQYEIDKRADIMEYLLLCRELIMSYGVPCEIEGLKHAKKKGLPDR